MVFSRLGRLKIFLSTAITMDESGSSVIGIIVGVVIAVLTLMISTITVLVVILVYHNKQQHASEV